MKKISILVAFAMLLALAAACAPAAAPVVEEAPAVEEAAPAEEAPAEEAAMDEGLVCGMTAEELDGKISLYEGGYDRPEWTTVAPEKTVRIAFLSYQNNPFWVQQKVGVLQAQDEAEAAGLDAEIDFVVVSEDLDPTKMVAAIETAIVQEYDIIIMFPLNESVVAAVQKAADAGILVGHFATDAAGSARSVVIGQDLFNAGKMAGYLMAKENGGKGKVGIITGQFGVTPHELRTEGFKEALAECPDMEVVGIVEAFDSSDQTYAAAQNFMAANPDLVGLYMTAGGPFGAGRAVEEAGMVGKVSVIGFDVTEQHIPYVESGSMVTIHQHEPWQSHDVIVYLYNLLVAGEEVPCENGYCFTPAEVVSKDNVADFWPTE